MYGLFGRIGAGELILVLVVALVIFGPSKLPEIGKSLGKSINEFKRSINSDDKDETESRPKNEDVLSKPKEPRNDQNDENE